MFYYHCLHFAAKQFSGKGLFKAVEQTFIIYRTYYKGLPKRIEVLKNVVKSEDIEKIVKLVQSENNTSLLIEQADKFYIQTLIKERTNILSNLSSISELEKTEKDDKELSKMIAEERNELNDRLIDTECNLIDNIVPQIPNSNEVILEITAGIGGQEAMLFAKKLYEMYLGYIYYKNWTVTSEDVDETDLGGMRHATLFIEGLDSLKCLRHESGVHRVQRVPSTEKSGRMHTSTVAVSVLPQPEEIDVNLKDKDIVIETKKASGAGGQHVNTTESAIRVTHIPTGIAVECQTDRSQINNRKIALQKLCAKLFALQEKEQIVSSRMSKKMQVGTSARSDKIRTYHFHQDRITDHRISKTLHNVTEFLEGQEPLDSMIEDLILLTEKERLEVFFQTLKSQAL